MKNVRVLLVNVLFLALCSCVSENEKTDLAVRPNILLIVADDLGYADLGFLGSEIETPNIDQLAADGIIFSRFHTANMCAPTRAMLLTGQDNHVAGMGAQGSSANALGYEGHLTDRVMPVPEVLKTAGYETMMAGKWHLGYAAEHNPKEKGFDHSFALLAGAGNHYWGRGLFDDHPMSPYTENGDSVAWPKGAYSTDFYTDKLIEYIGEDRSDKHPFFAFAAYTSPHWPLQVDTSYWHKYRGMYDEGYEVLREKNLSSMIKSGIVPLGTELPEIHPSVISWDSLNPEQQRFEARKMELYAGMVENLDENIGRLVSHLKSIGAYENTVIVFMSDNGAAANDFYNNGPYQDFIRANYTEEYDSMGLPQSFISYGPQWAEAGSAPFRYFKGYASEGGTLAPMIISGRGVSSSEEIYAHFTSVLDLAPTFYSWASAEYPDSLDEKALKPLMGKPLLSALIDPAHPVHSTEEVYGHEHYGKISFRKGPWKIVNRIDVEDPERFGMYRIEEDISEQTDLSAQEPEIFEGLVIEWEQYMKDNLIVLPTPSVD